MMTILMSPNVVFIDAQSFNDLVSKPETLVVDMRNHYESEIGHFEGAITPDVDTFRDSLPLIEDHLKAHKKDKNIVMYCTGGIRCEKASAYFKHKGFENVFQLEGGIIEYTRQVKTKGLDNKFRGKNFVFDERRASKSLTKSLPFVISVELHVTPMSIVQMKLVICCLSNVNLVPKRTWGVVLTHVPISSNSLSNNKNN